MSLLSSSFISRLRYAIEKNGFWVYFLVLFLGGTPYPTINNKDLVGKLKSGYRMGKSDNCTQPLCVLLFCCWFFCSFILSLFTFEVLFYFLQYFVMYNKDILKMSVIYRNVNICFENSICLNVLSH